MADISNITVSAEGVNTVCEIKDKVARNNIALNRTTLGYQCKNLLKNTAVTKTVNGVTFTVNSDGSITATQTTTSPSNATIKVATMTLKPGTYILTGDDEIRLSGFGAIRFYVGSTIYSSNKPHTFDTEVTIDVWLFVWQGVNINGSKTIYPMLRYADITDDTYEPYKESVDERLIQNKSDIAVNKSTLGYQCKNLFNPNAVNWYQPTKTSIAKDGTITSTATSDSRVWSYENAEYFLTLSAGKYIVRTVTETIDDTASINENIRGYNESGTQLFDIYPNAIGTRTTSFTLTETAKIAIMFKLFTQTCKIMIHDADITDSTYEPYKENVDERLIQNKSDIIINKTTLGTQCKNLLKNTAVTKTVNGVTFTVNDDSTITANGTATSRIIFLVGTAYISQTGNYTYTGTPSGGASATYSMNYRNSNVYKDVDTGNGTTAQFEGGKTYEAVIDIRSGVTISNLTFKPMLRYADITDSTYEPYKENVDERLIQNKSDIIINKTTLGTQCKNLHDTLSVNWYQPGKTSVASDGTVTTTITSDSRNFTYANSEHYITLEAGNYIITANTLKFAAGSSALIRGCNSDNQSLFALSVSSAGLHKAAFSLSKKTTIGIMYKLYSQTCTIMIRDADILGDTYETYSDNVDTRLIENKSNTAINKSTLGYQCKNLLKNNAVTKTVNGITFTVNDDKSVTLNGASTAQADFYLRGAWGSTSEILQKNKYIASIGVSQSSIFNGVVMHCINNTTSIGSPSCNYPSLAVNSAITAVYISVSKGYTFSNYKLYPMIRYADITDDTYEPYQPSVQEQITALEERIAALGG